MEKSSIKILFKKMLIYRYMMNNGLASYFD